MSKFDEISITEIRIGYEEGKHFATGNVNFGASSAEGPEISVKLSVDVEPSDSVQALRIALTQEAIFLLREVAALPDETATDRLHLGSRTYKDRPALFDWTSN